MLTLVRWIERLQSPASLSLDETLGDIVAHGANAVAAVSGVCVNSTRRSAAEHMAHKLLLHVLCDTAQRLLVRTRHPTHWVQAARCLHAMAVLAGVGLPDAAIEQLVERSVANDSMNLHITTRMYRIVHCALLCSPHFTASLDVPADHDTACVVLGVCAAAAAVVAVRPLSGLAVRNLLTTLQRVHAGAPSWHGVHVAACAFGCLALRYMIRETVRMTRPLYMSTVLETPACLTSTKITSVALPATHTLTMPWFLAMFNQSQAATADAVALVTSWLLPSVQPTDSTHTRDWHAVCAYLSVLRVATCVYDGCAGSAKPRCSDTVRGLMSATGMGIFEELCGAPDVSPACVMLVVALLFNLPLRVWPSVGERCTICTADHCRMLCTVAAAVLRCHGSAAGSHDVHALQHAYRLLATMVLVLAKVLLPGPGTAATASHQPVTLVDGQLQLTAAMVRLLTALCHMIGLQDNAVQRPADLRWACTAVSMGACVLTAPQVFNPWLDNAGAVAHKDEWELMERETWWESVLHACLRTPAKLEHTGLPFEEGIMAVPQLLDTATLVEAETDTPAWFNLLLVVATTTQPQTDAAFNTPRARFEHAASTALARQVRACRWVTHLHAEIMKLRDSSAVALVKPVYRLNTLAALARLMNRHKTEPGAETDSRRLVYIACSTVVPEPTAVVAGTMRLTVPSGTPCARKVEHIMSTLYELVDMHDTVAVGALLEPSSIRPVCYPAHRLIDDLQYGQLWRYGWFRTQALVKTVWRVSNCPVVVIHACTLLFDLLDKLLCVSTTTTTTPGTGAGAGAGAGAVTRAGSTPGHMCHALLFKRCNTAGFALKALRVAGVQLGARQCTFEMATHCVALANTAMRAIAHLLQLGSVCNVDDVLATALRVVWHSNIVRHTLGPAFRRLLDALLPYVLVRHGAPAAEALLGAKGVCGRVLFVVSQLWEYASACCEFGVDGTQQLVLHAEDVAWAGTVRALLDARAVLPSCRAVQSLLNKLLLPLVCVTIRSDEGAAHAAGAPSMHLHCRTAFALCTAVLCSSKRRGMRCQTATCCTGTPDGALCCPVASARLLMRVVVKLLLVHVLQVVQVQPTAGFSANALTLTYDMAALHVQAVAAAANPATQLFGFEYWVQRTVAHVGAQVPHCTQALTFVVRMYMLWPGYVPQNTWECTVSFLVNRLTAYVLPISTPNSDDWVQITLYLRALGRLCPQHHTSAATSPHAQIQHITAAIHARCKADGSIPLPVFTAAHECAVAWHVQL